jgi:polyhydroxybutyrate depolymerase
MTDTVDGLRAGAACQHPRMRPVVVAFFLAVLALAACNDDDDGAPASADATDATDAASVAPRPSAGCQATPVAPGQSEQRLGDRTYIRMVPSGTDGPVPLVVDFHGYQEGSTVHAQMSGLPTYGQQEGFATILPQGTGKPVHWDVRLDSPDLVFVGKLLDEAHRTMCIDEARVYVTGLSNGAGMVSSMACVYADRIAAVAPVAGAIELEGCEPSEEVPMVSFHGTADPFLRYEGGLGPAGLALPAPDGSNRTFAELGVTGILVEGPSRPAILAAWADTNGCDDKPSVTKIEPDVERMVWDCPSGADVELYTIVGGGHAWPGSEFSMSVAAIVGRTTTTIDANEVMWQFFQDHARR